MSKNAARRNAAVVSPDQRDSAPEDMSGEVHPLRPNRSFRLGRRGRLSVPLAAVLVVAMVAAMLVAAPQQLGGPAPAAAQVGVEPG